MDKIVDWLLEKENPSVRYFTLKYLCGCTADDPEVQTTQRAIMRSEPVKAILAAQQPEGYWAKAGSGYSPKYQATSWQILFLAELGADGHNRQVRRGCEYYINHAQASNGGFSAIASAAPSGAIHCLDGNMIWALIALGYGEDERVQRAVEWLAGAITGDDFDNWYASSVLGPGFRCAANQGQPCAWGAVKSLRALAALPAEWQSARAKKSKTMASEFLLDHDLAQAAYPYVGRVSGEWFKFGFPLSYTSDVLEAALAVVEAGYGSDARLKPALELIRSRRTDDGRWLLKHSLNRKMWIDIEKKGKPSKWVTLRALRVLMAAERNNSPWSSAEQAN